MTRVVIKFKDGSYVNVSADCLDIRDGLIMAWNEEPLVAIAQASEVVSCHMSEQIEGSK